MKEKNCEEEDLQSDLNANDDQSWSTNSKTTIPFANFYITRGQSSSNCSGSQHKLSEQLANTSINNNVDESLFEFDLIDIPNHKPRLERSQIYSNVRVLYGDEHLSFVYLMLNEH